MELRDTNKSYERVVITCLKFPHRVTFALFSVRGIGLNYSYLVVESHWSNSFTCFLAFIPSSLHPRVTDGPL